MLSEQTWRRVLAQFKKLLAEHLDGKKGLHELYRAGFDAVAEEFRGNPHELLQALRDGKLREVTWKVSREAGWPDPPLVCFAPPIHSLVRRGGESVWESSPHERRIAYEGFKVPASFPNQFEELLRGRSLSWEAEAETALVGPAYTTAQASADEERGKRRLTWLQSQLVS